MTRPFFPPRATSAAPVTLAKPMPQPTQAQRRIVSAAEMMFIEACSSLRPEQLEEIAANVWTARFGAARAERMGERIGTLSHLKGRV